MGVWLHFRLERCKHLIFVGWIFHETLIEAILMASSYRMDIPCPNVSSRSWVVVSVRSTGQANTAPLRVSKKSLIWHGNPDPLRIPGFHHHIDQRLISSMMCVCTLTSRSREALNEGYVDV